MFMLTNWCGAENQFHQYLREMGGKNASQSP